MILATRRTIVIMETSKVGVEERRWTLRGGRRGGFAALETVGGGDAPAPGGTAGAGVSRPPFLGEPNGRFHRIRRYDPVFRRTIMARCEGTTRSGNQCRLDARPGSRFCHLHDAAEEDAGRGKAEAAQEDVEFGDLVHLLVAGAVVTGFFLILRSLGRWIPKL